MRCPNISGRAQSDSTSTNFCTAACEAKFSIIVTLGMADTPIFDGMKVHYNHVRKHDSIRKTPAEAAGISTEGTNKWKTIVQNSSLYLLETNQRV